MIDWSRIAEPTADGSDTRGRAGPPRAGADALAPAAAAPHRGARGGAPGCRRGRRSGSTRRSCPVRAFAPLTGLPEGLVEAVALVRRWPAMAAQWPRIVHTVQCFTRHGGDGRRRDAGRIVQPHISRRGFGRDRADRRTSPPGAAQCDRARGGATNKLRPLGVDNERAVRLIVNPPDALYASPIVVDRPRPMTAVLHAPVIRSST